MYQSKIAGVGSYVPENVVTNDDLAKIMDTSDEWIQERTGIKERRHIKKGDGNSTAIMGVKAAKIAIERAKIDKDDIDLIVFATLSPDYYFPGCGVQVQEMLDINTCPALDVRNQCSGFIYGLSTADQFIKTGMYKNVLVIGSENHSGGLDFTSRGRSVSVIFGDGAGAVVLTRSDHNGEGILSTHLHSEGKHALELSLKGPSTEHWVPEIIAENPQGDDIPYYPYMNGQFVFKNAIQRFSEVIMEGLKANGLEVKDIDMLIPHQANLRISQFVQQKFGLSDDQIFNNIQKYGNTTAASIPIALCEAWEKGKIKDEDVVVLAAFGSGFTWASAVISW
ncbi:3-oxoacyl-ACP synthase III family protein [Salegentibacter mishustinae]|jgi:3-oxoacyl-[acyl-carrier-protein] synthase-3|uniref:Beta-ketoacyl-[acyl-carrier-protein] synthase III n=1 Tax=Salegentibacter mishustinae TaxID=270918 RepID=A0A0Q9ZHM0_9FLAO|nr:beta-ketoacyl-ACP synthase III [Salegentibacter mishustinae]KRG28353.1 3-oxoacyl-ACP synthase [Salegentibacter mishustinae]MDX1427685.1 beta-ketoacyl-ACP synthase III [Salegentibacter mishustinae]PNW22289.1 3-oxoacyl-ACP synthase [Salegentibacter mishustinae]PZX67511.1 3-oxoacyl-[acyl-carrier-protein] synthase-3 [Salegentibacter mishustinae]GGW79263.1 3-oxoacyl-[acyl-carrier-protein] synthase 3 [Salegentibacter mishustinae]